MAKFTFKTEKSTGRYRSFYPDNHIIKLNKQQVGTISQKDGAWGISLEIEQDKTDADPCDFKWIRLARKDDSLQDAKDFLNRNIDTILQKYKLKLS